MIGPSIYGYIVRKLDGHGEFPRYPFQDNIEAHIKSKIIDRVQNRKLSLEPSQIDSCILQFKELGLLRFAESKERGEETFRGITLTEAGERHLTRLNMRRRQSDLQPA